MFIKLLFGVVNNFKMTKNNDELDLMQLKPINVGNVGIFNKDIVFSIFKNIFGEINIIMIVTEKDIDKEGYQEIETTYYSWSVYDSKNSIYIDEEIQKLNCKLQKEKLLSFKKAIRVYQNKVHKNSFLVNRILKMIRWGVFHIRRIFKFNF